MANKLNTARQYVRENYNNGEDFRWDVLSGKLQIRSTIHHPQSTVWQDLDSRKINTIACDCAEQTGVSVSPLEIRTVLNSEDIPSVNPLRAYLQSLDEYIPEDHNNHSWIDWLSSQVRVTNSGHPTIGDSRTIHNPQERFALCFRKWFVAMVASWLYDDVVNQQVLVLIGRQGIYKTTWLEHLLPPCLRAYGTKMANVRDLNKDERMRIAEFGLINMDEIDSMNDRELNQLKSLVTCSDINERAAYGYTKERRIRIASFCASGNNREFLTDQTGNRRWLPFDVESIENPFAYGDGSVFPYDQIYGEALYLLRMGFNYWFDLEDISALETHVESFQKVSNEAELLTVYFSPAQPGDAGAVFMSAAEISAQLVSYGNIKKPLALNKLSSVLQKAGFVARRTPTKRGFVVFVNRDIDNQRKLDARKANDDNDGNDDIF
ncbi:MAG: virulence-associated E family protein [Paludibacteraceae bacterium]|nr:virulence-associated E family protein [Paludibacteraceae bacterium]